MFYLYKESDGPFPRSGFQPWRTAITYEGSRHVGLMRRLFELRPWYQMAPDQSVIAAGQGEGEDHLQAARAQDGSFIIAYLPHGNPVSIDLTRISGSEVKAQWYDPRTGSWLPIGQYPNTGAREFTPPSAGEKEDWVLVIEDRQKNYPVERQP
jgi:hypothetical protein